MVVLLVARRRIAAGSVALGRPGLWLPPDFGVVESPGPHGLAAWSPGAASRHAMGFLGRPEVRR